MNTLESKADKKEITIPLFYNIPLPICGIALGFGTLSMQIPAEQCADSDFGGIVILL